MPMAARLPIMAIPCIPIRATLLLGRRTARVLETSGSLPPPICRPQPRGVRLHPVVTTRRLRPESGLWWPAASPCDCQRGALPRSSERSSSLSDTFEKHVETKGYLSPRQGSRKGPACAQNGTEGTRKGPHRAPLHPCLYISLTGAVETGGRRQGGGPLAGVLLARFPAVTTNSGLQKD